MPLAGGFLQHGYQCGLVWGAALAAGAEAHRRYGTGPAAHTAALLAARRTVESFETRHGTVNCLEITDLDKDSSAWKMIRVFLLQGKTIGCLRMASWFAPLALEAIESSLDEIDETPDPPVSCAAVVVREMGGSDLHEAMAAGLAGGIGLCGGACGALGAAIWMRGLNRGEEEGKQKLSFKHPADLATIERFLARTDYEFECAKIVGRTFEDVRDHAAYLRQGGCAELLEALATD